MKIHYFQAFSLIQPAIISGQLQPTGIRVKCHHHTQMLSITAGQTIEAGNTTAALANNITLSSASSLTIDETSSLTVSGDFTNSGSVTLNSTADDFSSLIVKELLLEISFTTDL